MGKRLQTRFSDINQRIIKRTRRDKTKSGREISKLKRKSDTDLVEPLKKLSKSEPTDKQQIHNLDDKTIQNELNNDNIYVEKLPNSNDIVLKIKHNISYDLLFSDELKNSFFNLIYRDFYFHILDEIGLEGLDGITIEAFWKRLSIALEGFPHINQYIKNFIWQNVILCSQHLSFFELPVERGELQIYNRFDYMNTEIGVVLELAYKLPDIYPPKFVDHPEVLGSCSTFNERVDISNVVSNLTIQEAEEMYGLKLVIVGDQHLRTFVLCGDLIDPLIEFLNTEYCFLERVGRSRKLGELTQGEMSIGSSFKMDSRSIFHYKKQLHAYEVISKQFFVIKSPLFDQNKTGSLLHLRRFYTNIRTHQSFRADELINLLKKQPNYRIEIRQLRKIYSDNYSYILKLLKNPDFKKIVRVKIYPYKTLYPNASYSECRNKNKSEKLITCYELVDPYINIVASWRVNDLEESDDDDDEKEEELSGQMIYNMDTIGNVYYQIYLNGDKGCTSEDIRLSTGFDTNTTRVGLKKLCQKGVINFVKRDIGKTRKFNYIARCLKKTDEQSSNITNIETERPKISSVKAKILERQKAALAKTTQIKSNIKIEPQEKKSAYINFLQVEKPLISDWKFLIKNYEFETKPQTIFSPLKDDIELSKKIEIGLTFLDFNSKQLFNINKVLDEINPNIRNPSVIQNIKNIYIHKYSKKCVETTILLLRATLEEITLKTELFKSESKVQTSLPDLTKIKSTFEGHYVQLKLDFMGDNPLVKYSENTNNINIQVIASTIPKAYVFEKKYVNKDNTITDRVLFRIQIILDLINEMKIIEELMKLNKLIMEVEMKNGYDKKIDRKPMYRIIKRLVEEGYIKVYKLVLQNNVINKTVIFICHPSISHTDDVIQTACQQLKWKFFTSVGKKSTKPQVAAVQKTLETKIRNSPFSQSDVLNSINEMNKLSKIQMTEISKKFNRKIGIVYGAKPKFTRMRVMHEFLYYLIYGYTGFPNPLPSDDIRQLFTSYCIELSDSDMKDMPNIHSDEISWKTFVPPLPIHTGWPNGWALVCDIILRFPITVLLKIHNCTFEDPELLEILNHPVKRFFLVKDLPERIRKTVLFKRKYLFSAYDTIHFLVFCGLVQFGPQKYKEKDQLFIYLNRKASIKNTTSSDPGYNEIEKKEYPLLPFYFNTHLDVEQYWQTLNTISLSTKLNSREPGKVVTLTYINTKSGIMQSIKSRTANEALLYDKGEIPGDGKGAAGLDSSLWPHLIRNWYWSSNGSSTQKSYSLYSNEILKEIPTKTMSFKDLRANVIPKFYLPPSSHNKVNKKFNKKPETQKRLGRRVAKYTRVIPKRPLKLAKRVYKDDIDNKIVKKMGTRRAKWLEPEEEPVMLCKVGDIIMNGMKRYKQQVVPFTVVRDVLHRVSPMSKYKTSRAIQRYWKKMQKGPYIGLEGKVANLFKLKPINDTFVLLLKRIDIRDEKMKKPFKLTDPQISSAYIILMSYIFRNKKTILDALEGNLVNNDHLSDDHIKYTEETAIEIGKKEKKFFDAKNEFDIKRDIVKSIIHSSLCAKEVTNFSNQLFKIYQNYPDNIIKEAVKELRDTNTISYRSKREKKTNVWDTPFFLSQFYIFFQCSTFNHVTADEAFNAFTNITKHRGNSIEGTVSTVQNKRYGQLLGISEFFSFYSNIRFIFYFPQNTIMLNPEIDNHDELVNELAIRYQLKLKEGNETEMDFETENDNYRTKNQDQELIPIDEDKEISDLTEQTKSIPSDNQDMDFAVDSGNSETISRLKTWITDYITTDSERRSPSPEFIIKHTEVDEDDICSEKPLEISEKIHGEQSDVLSSRGFISTEKNLIPTLDEIKEGMLKTNINDEERTIPHITELSDLLTKHFNELKMDTDTLLRLKNHFITEYATLNRVVVNEFEHLQDHYMVQYLDNSMKNKDMWNRIENGIIVRDFLTLPNYEKLIRASGGSDEDVELASEIIQYAANKELFGVTGSELKETFLWREEKCTLTSILKSLLEAGILLQMGIATLSFVHYKYHYAWVVERKCIALDTPSTSADLEHQGAIKSVRMKIMPWVRVNGQLDKSIFKDWITNLLSYSLDFPKITFGRLCEKFCYIKPVDLYYLLQILEELGCLELFIYESKETNLFTEWSMPEERYATCLDNLDDIVIQPHNVSLTRLGSFFYNSVTV